VTDIYPSVGKKNKQLADLLVEYLVQADNLIFRVSYATYPKEHEGTKSHYQDSGCLPIG